MRTEKLLRAGIAFLTATQFGVGCWALFLPRSFFDVPWVGMHMPYNAHLMMDYGAMSLATSVVLGVAVLTTERLVVRTALVTYLMFAVPHLVIHLRLSHHLAPADRARLLIALTTAVLIPLALLLLSTRPQPFTHGQERSTGGR
ncbi:hypothetical protein AB0H12_23540 [Actinosynnema sp. NPDC023794]